MLAVNIGDLTRDPLLAQLAIAPVIPNRRIVDAEKLPDGAAIVLECPDDRAEAILWLIRRKYPKHLIRVYRSKTGKGGWKRVDAPDPALLKA